MLTDAQSEVLVALNDLCELGGPVLLDHEDQLLPERLRDLDRPDVEVYQAVRDLHSLGLIDGITVDQRDYPVRINGLTARGRQELPRPV